MLLVINIATIPPTKPKKNWLTATEEKVAPSRAKRPSDAEAKIKKPLNTSMITSVSKMGSTEVRGNMATKITT